MSSFDSFVSTGEYYYKAFDVFKQKNGQFFKNVEIMRANMPSMIQRLLPLEQERSCFNVLSVGSGTGEMDVEILKIIKEELQRSQGSHQMKIFNRAIEVNKYPCDLYKEAVKSLNHQQLHFDIHNKSFEEYQQESAVETMKFDLIHFIHSIYFVDLEETLKHCMENELNHKGCLVFMVEGRDLMAWVLEKRRFPDWRGNSNRKCHKIDETTQKMFEIAKKYNWKYDVYAQEYFIDVTEVFDSESNEGNLLLDFLTHTKNFRDTADKQLVEETLKLVENHTTVKDGKCLGAKSESLIFIYK